mmetsp:Transcript_20765/g.48726  ORF Transcript_20765/g.48726 Transcript_20765/m.48726 type:complete len:445 (+) Transcript_20765:1062-2396(+)
MNTASSAQQLFLASSNGGVIGNGCTRTLTIGETRELAAALVVSKKLHDAKMDIAGLPRETLAQHVGTYFSTKYGLRALVLEWVSATNNAVATYRHADADVGALAAMLSHEVDEGYWPMHCAAKEVVHDLLRVYVRGKFPFLSELKLVELLAKRVTGKVPLAEDEWTDVLRYMHSNAEALTLTHTLRELARSRATDDGRGVVYFADMMHTICCFQLSQHRRFLTGFVGLFRHHDSDKDGCLTSTELVHLASRVDKSKGEAREAAALLARVDPKGVGKFTFSQAVAALAGEIVAMATGDGSGPRAPSNSWGALSAAVSSVSRFASPRETNATSLELSHGALAREWASLSLALPPLDAMLAGAAANSNIGPADPENANNVLRELKRLKSLGPHLANAKSDCEARTSPGQAGPLAVFGKPSEVLIELARLHPETVRLGGCEPAYSRAG